MSVKLSFPSGSFQNHLNAVGHGRQGVGRVQGHGGDAAAAEIDGRPLGDSVEERRHEDAQPTGTDAEELALCHRQSSLDRQLA